MSGRAPGPERSVAVRMYRNGFGDCFLLRFRAPEGSSNVLIDCGSLDLGKAELRRRVSDIAEVTGGRLDLLVLTHEHWDHLSGFNYAEDLVAGFEIGEVWLAWTENGDDPLARRLDRAKRAALAALERARLRLAAQGRDGRAAAERLEHVLGFFGPLAAGGGRATRPVRDFVRSNWGEPRFLEPGGRPLALPGLAGPRVYVLGPPRDEQLLKKSRPSTADPETFALAVGPGLGEGHLASLAKALGEELDAEEEVAFDRCLPFDADHPLRTTTAAARDDPFFADRYFGIGENGESWRQIEEDWLGTAEELALKLDSHTNNTSLVLAFELAPGGKVLLFPADAQVGNWLSWHSYASPEGADPEEEEDTVTARTLLRRTVLYKVGHHGSHSATLKALGLDLMVSADLVAMVPVSEAYAHEVRGWHEIPFGPMLEALRKRTRGRILRADGTLEALRAAEPPPGVPVAEHRAFLARTRADPDDHLWIEHEIAF